MAGIDSQHIKDLIAKGNRFEAMNIFIQSKFGKPDNPETGIKIKREVGEPILKSKKSKGGDKASQSKDNSESETDGSGSDSDSCGSSHASSSAPRSEALVPEVELKEDENLDVDIETVDPLSEALLPRPHLLDQPGPAHMGHPQQNMQGYGHMGGMPHYGGPPGGPYGPYCVQVPQYGPRGDGTHTSPVWLDPNSQQHHQQQLQHQQLQHHQQHHHQQHQQQQHQQQHQHQEEERDDDYIPRIQREKEPVPGDLHKKTHQKFFRDQGRPYISRATGKEIRGRAMGPPCNCKKRCWSKIELGADEIFSAFWDMGNFDEQNVYLYGNISIKPVSRHYVKGSNRRTYTFTYWCKVRGKHVEVCKEMFMGVHGLQNSRGRIGNLMKQMKDGNLLPKPDQRGKHSNRPNKYTEQSLQAARRHIEMYINRNMTLKKMYRDFYMPWCDENKIGAVSEDKYRRIYSEEYKVS
ncbi:uncharacterized protein LOC121876236 [Homarus americanus]|uniref:uncharacterized protein LOC121876236 n=1 Tax=Homarus americanus TaxID=6706 RepID=UPI001C443EF2|nr:uncharacterized protein LOC121876236 [Homarus americanus]XP_042237171.1 uncharacterized protein LOC121876236 [Homarus americanus]XP_042237172.1 uncharacterized protein LOC121876236 [Homarus americanus]